MAAFQFPDPTDTNTVTNEETGATYTWVADPGKWVLASSGGALPEAQEQVTYQIQTDKILRSSDPAIELVDSAGFYSNVKFSGTGGVGVTSDFNGLIIDGSSITSRVDILELQNPILKKSFTVANRDGIATIRDGEMSVDAQSTNNINFISIGPTSLEGLIAPQGMLGDTLIMSRVSDGESYRFTITGGAPGLYGVNQVDGLDATISLTSYYVEIFPANGAATNLENYYNRTEIDDKFENVDASTSRELALSLISGLKVAVTLATDFQDLREKMLLKLSEIEIAATLES
tara:strand:+ start:3333 stop:4199 length:867 start_codon:yes stop_codon:yes gene_type:complete